MPSFKQTRRHALTFAVTTTLLSLAVVSHAAVVELRQNDVGAYNGDCILSPAAPVPFPTKAPAAGTTGYDLPNNTTVTTTVYGYPSGTTFQFISDSAAAAANSAGTAQTGTPGNYTFYYDPQSFGRVAIGNFWIYGSYQFQGEVTLRTNVGHLLNQKSEDSHSTFEKVVFLGGANQRTPQLSVAANSMVSIAEVGIGTFANPEATGVYVKNGAGTLHFGSLT